MIVCFYANATEKTIKTVDFYRNDFEILESFGYEVKVAATIKEVLLMRNVGVYYTWWWNRAIIVKLFSALRGKKVIVCGVLDYFMPYKNKLDYISRPYWQKKMIEVALSVCDVNIFICRFEQTLAQRFFHVNNPEMVYLGVDTDLYIKNVYSESYSILNVAWSGKENAKRKGLYELIRSLKYVLRVFPDVRLNMVGRVGDGLGELKEIAIQEGVIHAVNFHGEVSRERKLELMRSNDLYVQPSFYEGFGAAVSEAMSSGLPLVCSAEGALREVGGSTSLALPVITPEAIAENIIKFYSFDFLARKNLSDKSAEHVRKNFSISERRKGLRKIFDELGILPRQSSR